MRLPDEAIETRQRIERDLVAKINHTLEPLLGPDKFRAGASVECDFSSGEQSEETFDPSKSVMAISQKTEDVTTGAASPSGRPVRRPGHRIQPAQSPAQRGHGFGRRLPPHREHHVPDQPRHAQDAPGAGFHQAACPFPCCSTIRSAGRAGSERSCPRPPETVKSIRDLVAGVVGVVAERGDQLIVESLPFESTLNVEPSGIRRRTRRRRLGRIRGNNSWRTGPCSSAWPRRCLVLMLFVAAVFRRGRRKPAPAEVAMPPALEPPPESSGPGGPAGERARYRGCIATRRAAKN